MREYRQAAKLIKKATRTARNLYRVPKGFVDEPLVSLYLDLYGGKH